jgi:putative cell wall-binding protein
MRCCCDILVRSTSLLDAWERELSVGWVELAMSCCCNIFSGSNPILDAMAEGACYSVDRVFVVKDRVICGHKIRSTYFQEGGKVDGAGVFILVASDGNDAK